MNKKTILTGVKPTGAPHVGNYIGAIKPFLDMAKDCSNVYMFIADYHALNAVQNAEALKRDSYNVAATYLACGLNPEEVIFYRQSDVPEIFEISLLLSAVTPKGLMDRAHSYKASIDKNREAGKDADFGVNMGLYTYPILMAADILMAQTDVVPVGKDQVQHIEFARDMAGYFNNTFKEVFKLPEYKLSETAAVLPGIDGRKMSKSYGNHIPVFIDEKARKKLVMKIMTDSKLPEESKNPDENIIFQIYQNFAKPNEVQTMRDAFTNGGMGYGDAKKLLLEALEREFATPSEIFADYISKPKLIDEMLAAGAEKARKKARETLSIAREAVGLRSL